jgi:hypothetical protein
MKILYQQFFVITTSTGEPILLHSHFYHYNKKAIAFYKYSAIALNSRLKLWLDLPACYFSLRFKAEPAPKAPMASKPKTELGSGIRSGVSALIKPIRFFRRFWEAG